ncbi:hypothetical protein BAnh1_03860 [Bartonella australis AUST/NH1]|uniref:DUF1214 domain-containing protein n=1 Tax=Bartonella australis (strain Aust/NH1) TaxID=1094489 RepID=M1NSE4_BARAA|nr:DUF1214 domain-containing protein [Bartonella australis]AGF74268.1 hypothetical protein BAnh1_03860 [Bartonella australis AUST/NH1]
MAINIASAFLIFSFSILFGTLSVDYMLNSSKNFGRLTIGEWSAYPQIGTLNADPYTRARTAKRGELSLGYVENVAFQAWRDNDGRPLQPYCHYLLEGQIPTARLFTLYAANQFLEPYISTKSIPFELHTHNAIYESDGSLRIHISPIPQTGNWLTTLSKKEFGLVLTLYDTPIMTITPLHKLIMPSIKRIPSGQKGCD